MMLELLAAAKLNLALEITGRRPDGYHELVSVMHTIDLCDVVRVSDAPSLELVVKGEQAHGAPEDGTNLAVAAARALADGTDEARRGVRIELVKRIPAGMGLGGGSADAAAVLRGLNQLWALGFSDERLSEVGAQLGSDVPFCVIGGAALVTGRGEHVEVLPDASDLELTLFFPDTDVPDKTRMMYSLVTPEDYSDGSRARALAERLRRGKTVGSGDLVNAFDRHLGRAVKAAGHAMARCRAAGLHVYACGSGPAFFSPVAVDRLPPGLVSELEGTWQVKVVASRILSRDAVRAVREV